MTTRTLVRLVFLPAFAAAVVIGSSASMATAQSSSSSSTKKVEKLEPPTPGQAKTDGIVVPMLVGLVVAGAALAANLIPSKRGHQD